MTRSSLFTGSVIRPAAALLILAASAALADPKPASVSGGGFTLTSQSIDLPADEAAFPEVKDTETLTLNCTACHSAGMILAQPHLTKEQWTAIVGKMRHTFGAPVDEQDVPTIIGGLMLVNRSPH